MSRYVNRNKSIRSAREVISDNVVINTINSLTVSQTGGGSSLSDLTDTNIIPENQSNGNVLTYDESSEKWITSNTIPAQISTKDTILNNILNPDKTNGVMIAELQSRIYSNNGTDLYKINVYANTGPDNFVLATWSAKFRYNSDILEFVDVTDGYSGYYNSVVSNSTTTVNPDPDFYPNLLQVGVSATGGQIEEWRGSDKKLFLCSINLKIKEGATPGWHFGYCGTIEAIMINQGVRPYGDGIGIWNEALTPYQFAKAGDDGSVHEFLVINEV